MALALFVGMAVFMSAMFGMWAGARHNPLSVERYTPPPKVIHLQMMGRAFRPEGTQTGRWTGANPHSANTPKHDVPPLEPVTFMRDPKTGRFMKTK